MSNVPPVLNRILLILIAGSAALATLAGFWWRGRELILPSPPEISIQCLSYSPFRAGQSPFDPDFVVPRGQIAEDLRQLAQITDCVRTYSTQQGLAAVVEVAAELGMEVLLGAWIGRDSAANRLEIDTAVELAESYPKAIRALIIGNEALLRREIDGAGLAALLNEAGARSGLPVTYADVWEFWLKNPDVAKAADFVTIHILPYWEDDPVGVSHAVKHLGDVLAEVREAIPGKRILIGETGWPSRGRSREEAVPSPVNQARFLHDFLTYAATDPSLDYNLIEAYDQPWKRALEGTVGGYWGLFDNARQWKSLLEGSVSNDPHWPAKAALVIALGITAGFLAVRRRVHGELKMAALALFAVHALSASTLLVAEHAYYAALTPWDWLLDAFALSGLGALAILFLPALTGHAMIPPRDPSLFLGELRKGIAWKLSGTFLVEALWICYGFAAAVAALLIAIDPRYRSFPNAHFLAPGILFFLTTLNRKFVTHLRPGPGRLLLFGLFLAAIPITLINEGLQNLDAWLWIAALLTFAVAWRHVPAPRS